MPPGVRKNQEGYGSLRMKRTQSGNEAKAKPATSMQDFLKLSQQTFASVLFCVRNWSKCFNYQLLKSSQCPLEVGSIALSILRVKRLKCKIMKKFAQCYSAVDQNARRCFS